MIIKPPTIFDYKNKSVFLAGTIDNGTAYPWADKIPEMINDDSVAFLNPRRDDWDTSLEQSIDNDKFVEQVEWELEGIRNCDIVFFNFLGGSKSPVTMLELGICISERPNDIIVVCPKDFWRKGNVDIVCSQKNITVYENLSQAIVELDRRLLQIEEPAK